MKFLPLAGKRGAGKYAIVDDDVYEQHKYRKWFYSPQGYAWAYDYSNGWKNAPAQLLHRLVLAAPLGLTVDHRDRDGLNNQRSNLRIATYSQQNLNQRLRADNTSGHRGIYWEPRRNCWRVCINYQRKQIHIGQFKDKNAAIAAYQTKARELYGEFAGVA